MNYYNEWDPQAAAWLRELIENKLIPEGVVDERSITEVQAKDLKGFTQCHFFAGIGGWPLALQLAGIPATTGLWTGSPPCQPFSAAGKQLGQYDPRHLAPVFLNLIGQCRPAILFGEQVAPAIAKSWMCDLQTHLEGEGYAVGFAVLPACSVGAPHKRDRLFFGAHRLADGDDDRQQSGSRRRRGGESPCQGDDVGGRGTPDKLADTDGKQRNGSRDERSRRRIESANGSGDRSVAHTDSERFQRERRDSDSQGREGPDFRQAGLLDGAGAENNTANPGHGFWSDADWLGCRDGKFRPVESGTFPLANGIPARVGRLRGYGNAIVPQVAAEFIKAFMAAKAETETKA
ncbi:MAG: DNA cytosine methyltransferase [Beijerinckiaceae bacterium]